MRYICQGAGGYFDFPPFWPPGDPRNPLKTTAPRGDGTAIFKTQPKQEVTVPGEGNGYSL